MAFIEAIGLSKSFPSPAGPRHVLDDVAIAVERGEFVSIVGFMGCGKSTLLNLLAGVTTPDTGCVRLGGEPLQGVPEADVDRLSELLAAPVVLGPRERPARRARRAADPRRARSRRHRPSAI